MNDQTSSLVHARRVTRTERLRDWTGGRDAALSQLAAFLPGAGRDYAAMRNTDFGPGEAQGVSMLSPWIRHRVMSEEEVVRVVLEAHAFDEAEKFIQEVCWRTYWKGWLEHRPEVWTAYLAEISEAEAEVARDAGLRKRLDHAIEGRTGIDCFDAWVHELAETGYLHNHARMWFASIWIFTLKLPWVLGAQLFLRHLLDGDAASNTLSWRWVGGLHTAGKIYLARQDNIETFTRGRFRPRAGDLAETAEALVEARPALQVNPIRRGARPDETRASVLLISEDDVGAEQWPLGAVPISGVALAPIPTRARYAPNVMRFKAEVFGDALERLGARFNVPTVAPEKPEDLIGFARALGASQVVSHFRTVGFAAPDLERWFSECRAAELFCVEVMREWDRAFWPHAKKGFFQLKTKIAPVLGELSLL